MANVLHGMNIRCRSLAPVVFALLVRGAMAEAQDGALWTFDTGG
jgi:hypothetical protein